MRRIELEDQLRIRFAAEGDDFDRGVEVGMVAAMMAAGLGSFERSVAADVEEPVRQLAEKLGYRVMSRPLSDGRVRLMLRLASRRPDLRVIQGR